VTDGFTRTGAQSLERLVESEDNRTVSGFDLDVETTIRLLRDSNNAFHTQINDILLTAFAHALAELTGERENYIVLEGHGREPLDPRVDPARTVGWFTSMFPVRLVAQADMRASLRGIKESLRRIPRKGIGYGALFGYDRALLPRINFNYLGQFGTDDGAASDAGWRITLEGAGTAVHPDNRDGNIMTINGYVIDGRLGFTFVTKLGQSTADSMVRRYRELLVELVDGLSTMDRSYLTPADIDHVC